jgi:hypothetical protein
MRRRVFNLFAFAFLAFAIYLIAFTKEESMQPTGKTVQALNGVNTTTAADKTSH